jgi:hypothetical protein
MKTVADYLAQAAKFEQLASEEKDPKFKSNLEKQAKEYRKLAAERARAERTPARDK